MVITFCIQHTQMIVFYFFRNKISVMETFKLVDEFSFFLGWSLINKCKTASIPAKKGVKVAVTGMKNIDLTKNTVKILRVNYSYNKKLENENNFKNHQQIVNCFENQEDEKFGPWRKNHNIQNTGNLKNYTSCFSNYFTKLYNYLAK